jgi:anti-sigma regulatory factor (Ser/Thr protein kinase)
MGRGMTADSHTVKLVPHPSAAKVARLAVGRWLDDWAVPHLLEDVDLITTELVTNAARLRTVFELTVSRGDDGSVLVEVRDFGPGKPVARAADPYEECGRGLFLVEAYAVEWGWRPECDGKTVWARCAR